MLPTLRQRLLLAVGLSMGGLCMAAAMRWLHAEDLSSGLSLFDTRVGVIPALLILLLSALPALISGLAAGAGGSVLAGAVVISGSLLVLAGLGGSIDGALMRADARDALPGVYRMLAFEAVLLTGMLLGFFLLLHALRPTLRRCIPGSFKSAPPKRVKAATLWPINPAGLLSGMICAAVGGVLSVVLIRSAAIGQVLGSLTVAFLIAGASARMLVNRPNVTAMLLSPMCVAVVAYLWIVGTAGDGQRFLEQYFGQAVPGIALALPLHYASAGVLGTAVGIGLGQGLIAGSEAARAANEAEKRKAAPPEPDPEGPPTSAGS